MCMRPTSKKILSIAISLIFISLVKGQTLMPKEILQISNLKTETEITNLLKEKGFDYNGYSGISRINEKEDSWCFRSFSDKREIINSFVAKVTDDSHHSKIILTLYNFYHYRDFVNNLLESKFIFKGIKTIESINYTQNNKMEHRTYLNFTKSNLSFLTRECIGYDSTPFYEIVFQQNNNGR